MWTFKQKISILLLLLLLVLPFSGALAPLGTVEASSNLGGWSAIGSSLDGYYFSVDDLGFRIHFNLEDGYLLSVRYLEFDDYGTCVADETYYGSWDVTQAGDVILTCDALGVYGEPFVILGDTAYFNLPSDEGIISLEFVSWGSMDQEQGSDTVAPDPEPDPVPDPVPDPPPIDPAPQTDPTPQNNPQTDTQTPTEPPQNNGETTEAPTDTTANQQPYAGEPGVKYAEGFMILEDAEAYFATLPRLFDPTKKEMVYSFEKLKKFYIEPNGFDLEIKTVPSKDPAHPVAFNLSLKNPTCYPWLGTEVHCFAPLSPKAIFTFKEDSLTMPGCRSQLSECAADWINENGEIETFTAEEIIPLSVTAAYMDKIYGVVTISYSLVDGYMEVKSFNYENPLRKASEDEKFLCEDLLLRTSTRQIDEQNPEVRTAIMTNTFDQEIVELRTYFMQTDGRGIFVEMDPLSHPQGLQPGLETEHIHDAGWLCGDVQNTDVPRSRYPSVLEMRFAPQDGQCLKVLYYPALSFIRMWYEPVELGAMQTPNEPATEPTDEPEAPIIFPKK